MISRVNGNNYSASAVAIAHRDAANRSDRSSFAKALSTLSSAKGSSAYVQEQKRAYAETGKFDVICVETKLASREGNRLNVEITIPETPDDEPASNERAFDGKIAHFSELMVYQAPESSELREFPLPHYGAGAESLIANATLNEVSNGALKDTRTEMYNLLLDYPADFDRLVSNVDQKYANQLRFFQAQNKIPPMERVLGLLRVSDSGQYTASMLDKLMRML